MSRLPQAFSIGELHRMGFGPNDVQAMAEVGLLRYSGQPTTFFVDGLGYSLVVSEQEVADIAAQARAARRLSGGAGPDPMDAQAVVDYEYTLAAVRNFYALPTDWQP